MTDIVSFQNDGLIDEAAITTLGVSVKEGPNPIGFFGTGLKYAIAIVLRNGGEIVVHRGLEEMTLTTQKQEIRGKEFGIVCLNGRQLGFTDELGKKWEPWMAVRELYCNVKDEAGDAILGMHEPAEGKTTIWVNWPAFAEAFRNLDKIILNSRPAHETSVASIHPGKTNNYYYRGIKVGRNADTFAFTYDLKTHQDLTEDRTLRYSFMADHDIGRAILACDDADLIERWLTVGKDFAEHSINLDSLGAAPSPAFLVAARNVVADTSRECNRSAKAVLEKHEPPPVPMPCRLTAQETQALADAIAFCRSLNFTVDEFPITVMDSLGPNVLGLADVEKRAIFISRRAFMMGDNQIAATLIEEWAHIKHRLVDCTYTMQNWIFDNLVHIGRQLAHERASGERIAA